MVRDRRSHPRSVGRGGGGFLAALAGAFGPPAGLIIPLFDVSLRPLPKHEIRLPSGPSRLDALASAARHDDHR